jgi:N-acetylglucosamine kinase-like BadF-type ATPase
MPDLRFYIGVDAGGTKTHALIADQTGRIHGAGRAGPGNWESVGLDGALRSLSQALHGALSRTGLGKADICVAGYGLAGMDWPSDEARLLPMLDQLELPGPRVLVNDAYVALRAGSDAVSAPLRWAASGAISALPRMWWRWRRARSPTLIPAAARPHC